MRKVLLAAITIQRYANAARIHLTNFINDIADVLKWPVIFGSVMLEMFLILGAIGLGLGMTLPVIQVPGSFLVYLIILESPIIYYMWRRIQHEDSLSRVLSEAFETDGVSMEQKVKEYKDLLKKSEKRVESNG